MKNRIALAERGRQFGYKAAAVLTCAMPAAVFAQETDPVVEAMTTISGKVTTYATGLVALAIVGVGFMVGVKYIKKARGVS